MTTSAFRFVIRQTARLPDLLRCIAVAFAIRS